MKVTPEEQDMIDLIAETERVEALQAALATAQAQVAEMRVVLSKCHGALLAFDMHRYIRDGELTEEIENALE